MTGGGDSAPLFTPEELAAAGAAAAEMQQEFDAWTAQLQTPEAKAEYAALAKELVEMAEAFKRDCAAGKYDLTAEEIEELRREGILVKRTVTPQKGRRTDD